MTMGPGSGSPPDDDATFADVLNRFTLDSGRGRRKRKKTKEPEAEVAPREDEPAVGEPPAEPGPSPQAFEAASAPGPPGFHESGPSSGSFEPSQGSGHFEPAQARNFGTGYFEPAVSNSGPMLPERPDLEPLDEETAAVRPYALTGGRTRASTALELETLVSVKDVVAARMDAGVPMQFEHRQVVEECRTPRSVAEIAALLRVPVGVARVLISDAADAGLITVHKTASGADNAEAHLMLMERVLSGLRRL